MAITVNIPAIMRPLTHGQRSVIAEGRTVGELIHALDQAFPGMQQRLVKEQVLIRFMNLYVNDIDVRFSGGLEATVKEGDTVTILPAVAGGQAPPLT